MRVRIIILLLALILAAPVGAQYVSGGGGGGGDLGGDWTMDTDTENVCILKLGTTTNWTWNSSTLTATAPGTLVVTTEVKVPTISGADGVDALVLSGGKTTLTTATVTGGLNVGAATLAGAAGQISAKKAAVGVMLSLNDSVETGGADTSGRFCVETNGTEADSDVLLKFWDSDEQAYRTFGWDEGVGSFYSPNGLKLDSSITCGDVNGAYINGTRYMILDNGGNGSESQIRMAGGLGAVNHSEALGILACKADGSLGTPYVGFSFWGPHFTARSVEMGYITTNAFVPLAALATPRKSTLTIASDAITVTGAYHDIEGQSGASDDLATINGGVDGALLTLRANHADHTITLVETGNILVPGASVALDNTGDTARLVYDGTLTKWLLLSFSDNN